MKAISMGWGVQSWTLAVMSALGHLERIDFAIHSDTTHERSSTYAFAVEWTPWLQEHKIKVVTVVNQDSEGTRVLMKEREVQIPAYTITEDKKGQIRRQCTGAWKIAPMRRWLQKNRNGKPIELWLGISKDEYHRAKDSGRKYIRHRFPLLELNMTRQDCLDYLAAHDLPSPGKSSCVFCPFLNKAAWADMRTNHPEDWKKAVEIDLSIRDARLPGELFIHNSRKPLSLAIPLIQEIAPKPVELLASDDIDAECDSGHCFL